MPFADERETPVNIFKMCLNNYAWSNRESIKHYTHFANCVARESTNSIFRNQIKPVLKFELRANTCEQRSQTTIYTSEPWSISG